MNKEKNIIQLNYKKCILCNITYHYNEYINYTIEDKSFNLICNHCCNKNKNIYDHVDFDENEMNDLFKSNNSSRRTSISDVSEGSTEYDMFSYEN
jgi:hypothetical protein